MDRKQTGEAFLKDMPALYRFALRLTRSPQDADEAVSRTALRSLEKAEAFRGESSIRTWIFGILINVVREMRKEGWREESLDEGPYPPNSEFDDGGRRLQPATEQGDDPEHVLLRTEGVERIRNELDTLPPLQRSAFHLRFIEGWEMEEICNALQIKATHLRVLLHRARLRLRERMIDYVKGESK
ncbi:MAG: sigma-70 family RNA polymerase sigma factor [Nitrospirae bacterium]|nr:sigma-70 family RNA polymerase sigma factor [Nitrospirota bacterium]